MNSGAKIVLNDDLQDKIREQCLVAIIFAPLPIIIELLFVSKKMQAAL